MNQQQDYLASNKALWEEWTGIHVQSRFYDVPGFKAGRITLGHFEREALGDVGGKRLLHLQCHFGMDTLSWARLGAEVTGVDFSPKAIGFARALSAELDIPATFIETNLYDLPDVLDAPERFDIVFTSYGVLSWLPDMARWAQIIGHYLKPGGIFYGIDAHPLAMIFEDEHDTQTLKVAYPYFNQGEPLKFEVEGSYADYDAHVEHDVEYTWQHSAGEIINALIDAGLSIRRVDELTQCAWAMFPAMMKEAEGGMWQWQDPDCDIPLMLAVTAAK